MKTIKITLSVPASTKMTDIQNMVRRIGCDLHALPDGTFDARPNHRTPINNIYTLPHQHPNRHKSTAPTPPAAA